MFTNLRAVKYAHKAFLARTRREITRELATANNFAQQHVRQFPDGYKHRTGAFAAKTKAKVIASGLGYRARISNTKKYGPVLEWGSRAHIIRARRAKALRFTSRGRTVYRKQVRHPGTRGYRPIWRAASAFYRVLGPNLQQRLSLIARRF